MTSATATSPALRVAVRGVGRRFPGADGSTRVVLRDIDLDIRPGEIIALLGASGSGKSTLLRLLGGLDRPDAGRIALDGVSVSEVDQRCAVAFQEPRLLPWRTIRRNVELGLPIGTDRAQGAQRITELLGLVQLTEAAELRPRQVSGGMAQRASLARALARGPGVLLLDEPFGALDALTRLTMQDLLLEIHAAEPATVLLVTHDVDEALALADRIVLLGADSVQAQPGSTIRAILDVPGVRPRDRADGRLANLRIELLDRLGVPTHHSPHYLSDAVRTQRARLAQLAAQQPQQPQQPQQRIDG